MESAGLKEQQDLEKLVGYTMTPEEAKVYAFHFDRIRFAKNQRDRAYKEFDDLTYEKDYYSNDEARNTYLRPKLNDGEVRIATGTTEKKVEVVINELLALNLQPEVLAFDDEDLEIDSTGKDFSDIVTRTNEIEKDDDFWIEAIQELLTQRAVFIEEVYNDTEVRDKRFKKGKKPTFRKCNRAEKRLLNGLQIFLGDITIPAYRFNEQPFIVKYDRIMYSTAKSIFKDCKNWKFVKPGANGNPWYSGSYKFKFSELNTQEVEIVTYMSFPDDEYQVYCNGIPMYDVGEALPWEYEGYNIKMFVVKAINRNFAYGRCLVAQAKTLQALNNESIRLMIRKFRQAIEPPLANSSGQVYSKDIWNPGSVVNGVRADQFSPLITHQGVTNSEFSMFDLIEKKVEEFIGASSMQQGLPGGNMTATQTMELQKQAAKMLGLSVYAVMRMKRDMTFLRIYNILENYLNPIGKEKDVLTGKLRDKFRSFTIGNTEFENGMMGKKVINFSDQDMSMEDRRQLMDYEDTKAKMGQPIRYVNINVNKVREVPIYFYVNVISKDKVGSALKKIMFTDKLNQGTLITNVTGRQFNADKIIDEFEREWNSKDLFQKPQPEPEQPMGMPGEVSPGGEQAQVTDQAKQMLSAIKSGVKSPGTKELSTEVPMPAIGAPA